MDYFAHGFWSYIFFHWTKRPWIAVLFGLVPDTSSWFIYMIYRLIMFEGFGRPMLNGIPNWVFMLYNISHSLFVASTAILIGYIILRKFPIYMLAWPMSIIIDTLTHTREFLPTPFLWPISEWHFPGISWGDKYFMIVNYTLITLSIAYIIFRMKKKRK